ncbi:MAG: carboxylating nicotinate-nucleotide diphosphorylase [Bacteroidetes bacterium]|nr:carboxylating nicotinate-nucleotide diphosphorylase [Bacteroidota bacterium]
MSSYFSLYKQQFSLKKFVANCLEEDLRKGDITSLSIIKGTANGKMHLLVKEQGIIAGVEAACAIIKLIDKSIKTKVLIQDGRTVKQGDVVFTLEGRLHKLLIAERLILNVMQRMSGIATKTSHFQQLCKGTKAKVIDTRKTTPGFRFFEKWAVVIGGGKNHRYGLFDMILIKDNHIDVAGGIVEAIEKSNKYIKQNKLKIAVEVETRTIKDVEKVLNFGKVQRIMLDNFSISNTKKAVALINGKFEIESSGGINEKTIAQYAKTGVDFISVGALTHHVKSLDLSLKVIGGGAS